MGLLRCAYCHEETADLVPCSTCGTLLHSTCWRAVECCPTLGCLGNLSDAERGPRCDVCRLAVGDRRFRFCEGCCLRYHTACLEEELACPACYGPSITCDWDDTKVWLPGESLVAYAIFGWVAGMVLVSGGGSRNGSPLEVLATLIIFGGLGVGLGRWIEGRSARRYRAFLEQIEPWSRWASAARRLTGGDLDGAVQDLTLGLGLGDGTFDPPLWYLRGVCHVAAGEAELAKSSLEAGRSADPVGAALFLLALGAEPGPEPERSTPWEEALWQFAVGGSEEDLLAAVLAHADREDDQHCRAEALDFMGAFAERDGRQEDARKHYRSCASLSVEPHFATSFSRARLRRLGGVDRPRVRVRLERRASE